MRLDMVTSSYMLGLLSVAPFGVAQGVEALSRYGQAATYLQSPPTLIIHGGKSDPSNAYSYTSAPNTNTVLVLPLDQPFQTSSPPFTQISSDSPSYAWHCLLPSGDQLLSFGGDGGPELAIQTNTDSSWLLEPQQISRSGLANVSWSQQDASWAQQPIRRVHHSYAGQFITGGLRNDGSGTAYSDVYAFNGSAFEQLPPLPTSLYHHSSVLLPNGTLIVLGGVSNDKGQVQLASLDTVWHFDTTSSQSRWQAHTISGAVPSPRRGSTASLNTAGDAAILIGGTSLDLSEASAETWRLELSTELRWTKVAESGVARFDHVAISAGDDQVLVCGGYGGSGPVDATFEVFSFSSNSYVDNFEPHAASEGPVDQPVVGTGDSKDQKTSGETSKGSQDSKPPSQGQDGSKPDDKPNDSTTGHPSPSDPAEPERKASLTLPIALGTILGLLACAAVGLVVVWYRRRMRRRRQGPYFRQPPKREYAPDPEKDGAGLLLGRAAPIARARLAPGPQSVSVSPVPMIHRHLRSVKRVLSTGSRTTRRFDILVDEDSREFAAARGEGEHWKSAASLLGSGDDEDDESWFTLPIRGGPVPTPRLSSLASQNPFDDPAVTSTPSTDPPSLNSRRSLSTTGEPATIHTATVVTRTFVPIKRTDTFLNRLTGVFLGTSPSSTPTNERIRDPTPAPSLWPLDSSNLFGETPSLELLPPPVSFAFRPGAPGQSVSSLATAQSYRDMDVVQRERTRTETTDGDEDEGVQGVDVQEIKAESSSKPVTEDSTAVIPPSPSSTPTKAVTINDFAVPLRHITPPPHLPTSPAATPSPRHVRRPVREVVESINKRSTPHPPRTRTRTTYEAVRKSALIVTNPDGGLPRRA